ncbi:MAG TPA: FIST N-terminal domain-containing protein [Acidimicrobiia bacterium]
MELESRAWRMGHGWSAPLPAHLDGSGTLVVAFGDKDIAGEPEPLADLGSAFPHSHVIGCSTAGQILGPTLSDSTLVVAVARFASTHVSSAWARVTEAGESCAAGEAVARTLAGPGLRAVFVLSDGLLVNGSALVRGLSSGLPADVVITGGLAGDGDRFGSTWVIADGEPRTGAVAGIGLAGDALRIGTGSFGGWDIFGPERLITRAAGNVLSELDGRPALELYKEYLGDLADGLPATALLFPLAIRASHRERRRTVRTVLAVDDDAQSMTFAGDVPEGWLAQLMRANKDRLVDGAMEAALRCAGGGGAARGPVLALAISCVGRRIVLGERTEEEIEATLEVLPPTTELVGFYSYGEIAPHGEGVSDLHNQTMTLTTIAESSR